MDAAHTPPSHLLRTHDSLYWLYKQRGAPANPSERKYRDFGLALYHLLEAAENIESAFGCTWTDRQGNLGCDGPTFKRSLAALLGRCERVIQENAFVHYAGTDTPRTVENIFWGATAQPEIDVLLSTIASQIQSFTLIYESLSNQQPSREPSAEQSRERSLPQPLPSESSSHTQRRANSVATTHRASLDDYFIPPAIISRFRTATTRHAPPGYVSPYEFPFHIGVSTIMAHLEVSTTQARNGERQSVDQYLSLLKAQWLLQAVKGFPDFHNLRHDAPDRRVVQELEHTVLVQRMRQDLTRYDPAELEALPADRFFIWEATPKNVLRDRMQPSGQEKLIMTADLPVHRNYSGCKMVIFRDLANRRGTTIRIARQWYQNGRPLPPESNTVDCFSNILRPLYFISAMTSQPLCVEICSAEGGHPELYELRDLKDVFRLQWAMTSYAVFSDLEDVDWTITRSLKQTIRNTGARVQIWWYDPDDELEEAAAKPVEPSSQATGHASILSRMTGASGKVLLQESAPLRMPGVSSTTTKHTSTEVIEALPPYEPLLVIYSVEQSRYEFLSLKLHGRMFLDATACNCAKRPTTCLRSIIKSSNSGKCEVKRVSVPRHGTSSLPNLALFARSSLKGMGHHPDLGQAEDVASRELVLDFASARTRQRFNQAFEFIIRLQRNREATQGILAERAEYLTNKLQGKGGVKDRITGSVDAIAAINARSNSINPSFYQPQFSESASPGRRDSALGSSPPGAQWNGPNANGVSPQRLSRVQTAASDGSASSGSQGGPFATPPLNTWNPHSPYEEFPGHPRTQSNASAFSSTSLPVPSRPSRSSSNLDEQAPRPHTSMSATAVELGVPSIQLYQDTTRPVQSPQSYFPNHLAATELHGHSYIPPRHASIELEAHPYTPPPYIPTSEYQQPPSLPHSTNPFASPFRRPTNPPPGPPVVELDGLQISHPPGRPSPSASQNCRTGGAGGRHVGEGWL